MENSNKIDSCTACLEQRLAALAAKRDSLCSTTERLSSERDNLTGVVDRMRELIVLVIRKHQDALTPIEQAFHTLGCVIAQIILRGRGRVEEGAGVCRPPRGCPQGVSTTSQEACGGSPAAYLCRSSGAQGVDHRTVRVSRRGLP